MSPESQRIAIAEACGKIPCWHKNEVINSRLGYDERFPNYHWEHPDDPVSYRCVDCGRVRGSLIDDSSLHYFLHNTPDYLNDLNAMHEAEKVLIDSGKAMGYGQNLWRVHGAGLMMWNATAAQRAEAFLRTLERWKEGA